MVINIKDDTFEITSEMFDIICELVISKNSSRYFIYCLENMGMYMFTNDFFDDKESFLNLLHDYIEKGFNVYFVEDGVKNVEYSK